MEDAELVSFQQLVPTGGAVDTSDVEMAGEIDAERRHEERVIVWTDGACVHNQDCRLRRAGAGIFYSKGSPRNRSVALAGRDQTNQKAELLAVVLTLRNEDRPVEIRTDSQYVFAGARGWRHWHDRGWKGDHAELWGELADLMSRRSESDVCLTKVKGHARERDVRRGLVTQEDKDGNDAADKLATTAADWHAAPEELVARAAARKQMTTATHKMMLSIIKARRKEESRRGLAAAELEESGSESESENQPSVHTNVSHRGRPSAAEPG
jgi:ribonuclease HI